MHKLRKEAQLGLSEYSAESEASPRRRWTLSARWVRETEVEVRIAVGSGVNAHLM